jgi:hypothetical protein
VIQLRHRQPSLWHSGLAKDIEDLWEPWMKEVDQLLEDAALVESVFSDHFGPDGLTQSRQRLGIRHFLVPNAGERAINRLYGVTNTDALTFATVALLLAAIALLACHIPARRATKIEPNVALRCE